MSCLLYKFRSRPIIIQRQHIQSNPLFSYFCPNFLVSFSFSSIRSISHHFNLQSCHGSHISPDQTLLGRRRSTSSQPDGAPDCHRSQQNQSVRFLKSDCPVSTVSSRGFRFLFILCGNTDIYSNPNGLGQPTEASPLGLENTAGHLSHSKKTKHRRSLCRRRHSEPALPSTADIQPFPVVAVADLRRGPVVSTS
jgi:hypothetical protein